MKKRLYEEIIRKKRQGYKIGGKSKLLRLYRESLKPLTRGKREILVGLALGDMNIKRLKTGTRVRWEYGYKSERYIKHIYQLFKDLIISEPYEKERNGVKTWRVQTLTLKELEFLSELFINSEGKKYVRKNIIKDNVTNISLAYWGWWRIIQEEKV